MAVQSVKVHGLRELHRALKNYADDVKKELEAELKDAGEIVATGARARFAMIDARSAAGFKPRVRGFGRVVVEQTRRRKTGRRPDYGRLQMRRALLPAREAAEPRVVDALEAMLDRIGRKEGF